jgi:hypothetical protein
VEKLDESPRERIDAGVPTLIEVAEPFVERGQIEFFD